MMFANQLTKFDLVMEGQDQEEEKWDFYQSTRKVQFHKAEIFHNFNYLATYVYIKITHTGRDTGAY